MLGSELLGGEPGKDFKIPNSEFPFITWHSGLSTRSEGGTMALNAEDGKKMLQLITSRYNDRHWRKKIEKTLSLSQSGVTDPVQRQIFMFLKIGLKAYKSRRADPDSWIIGGNATKEVIERMKFQPHLVGLSIKKEDVAFLGTDPGDEVTEAWWDAMLAQWFDEQEEVTPAEEGREAADSDTSSTIKSKV